jgi:hypothetical protein
VRKGLCGSRRENAFNYEVHEGHEGFENLLFDFVLCMSFVVQSPIEPDIQLLHG